MRTRSSLGMLSSSQTSLSSTTGSSNGSSTRHSVSDLRRPPSARSYRPASPSSRQQSSSRPGSAMSTSRPSTPLHRPQEPYTGTISVSIRPNPHSIHPLQPSPWIVNLYENLIANSTDGSSFTFDNVFISDIGLTNRHVYEKSCSEIVQRFLTDGYNGTVFAYGMTGSGKTYSMKGNELDPGFVELAVNDLFNKIENETNSKTHTVAISYLEIYNEKIIDLLNPTNVAELKIRDDPVYGTKIIGITSPTIDSRDQLLKLLRRGDNNRKTSATDYNSRSSRSHAILQIRLTTIDLSNNTELNRTLSLCDLAGSEKAASSLERRKEGSYINKSLLALSTVINKLSVASHSLLNDHIPYRDSKLTRLLQPALSGSSLVLILCTIHVGPGMSNLSESQYVSETYNTLRFAARAKDIVMNVESNKSTRLGPGGDSDRFIADLQRTIESQRLEINMLKVNLSISSNISTETLVGNNNNTVNLESYAEIEAENKVLNEKLEHLTRLTNLQKTETIILKNDTLNDLMGDGSSQMMMANLEEFYKRVTYEVEEYTSYINLLESQLKQSYKEGAITAGSSNPPPPSPSSTVLERQLENSIKEKEDEIYNLKEMIKVKDHIIKSLTKTSKLRRLADATSNNNDTTSIKTDKENNNEFSYRKKSPLESDVRNLMA
ncbi:uncharacterized protein KQ657_000355 [Scheffersomyces spartinae]|uniref:Kinesin motor domain-containing protein n=1 Tax=Scheffersomyces spartinae TaxID=45513 RepID=A0A9P7V9T3_9ASCO|nr:uncharacterized protein KQ657_000355 [Scheffersomyces spartinae]KAG7193670.1 hypothetical protein KQ657_000355 [Scheffersomyces spartinae]